MLYEEIKPFVLEEDDDEVAEPEEGEAEVAEEEEGDGDDTDLTEE